jgi:hypothetical protein
MGKTKQETVMPEYRCRFGDGSDEWTAEWIAAVGPNAAAEEFVSRFVIEGPTVDVHVALGNGYAATAHEITLTLAPKTETRFRVIKEKT